MDALTHAVIGVAVAGFSGHPVSIHDPVYIASMLGSQAPDFDIVTRLQGPMAYLKSHRAFSHSLPGLVMWSSLITAGFYMFSPSSPWAEVLLWSFLGGLSHIFLDFCNTHGASILWPFHSKRKSLSLLNVFDPVLLGLLISLYLYRLPVRDLSLASVSIIALYIFARYLLKRRSAAWLNQYFDGHSVHHMLIMPCLTRIFHWDFLIKTETTYFIGRIGAFYPIVTFNTELPVRAASALSAEAQKTVIGRFFQAFTPFSYFTECEDEETTTVHIYDLRYYRKTRFLHSGTIVYREDHTPCQSYIQSYGEKIYIQC